MNTNYKTGLSSNEVLESRKKYGSNKLTAKRKNTFFKLVLESLSDPIIKILIIALCVKIVFLFHDSNIYETLGIAIAVFLAAFISALSEYGSEKAFDKLNNENRFIKTKVLRNGQKQTIIMDEVVVGDIVFLDSGDKIPCDGYIIDGKIDVDESALTGETKERHKDNVEKDLLMGSIVTNGRATMVATIVGDKTYYGTIASMVQDSSVESPLRIRLRKLASTISKFGYVAAIIILLSYLFNVFVIGNNFDLKEIIKLKDFFPHLIYGLTLSVAVVVMAVPEGLPMMITLVLSSNMKRMLKRNVLVRKLVGIETAGSLNILFTDKTGTLTEGRLKVTKFVDSNFIEYSNINSLDSELKDIVYQSLVYNNSSFLNNSVAEGGNSTDKAILEFIKNDDKSKYKILLNEEFDSNKKYSRVKTNYKYGTYFIKGAYEKIIENSSYYLNNNLEKRTLLNKDKILNNIKKYTNDGYRIIALAISDKDSLKDITYLGIILIKDVIRKKAKEGIITIKKAGINVVMVTGDAKDTAINVAKNIGIITSEKDIVLTSSELNSMSDENVKKIIPNLKVLCRSLPQDKNRLVVLSQEMDLIVGMTGDGVNDAPALKRADVGFSMGSGTEVAKETSDIVILDNNIQSIGIAILYGRTIFKSIRKFVIFQLSVNVCAVLLSVIGPFIGILTPITVIQVLWVNMVMDTFAGLAFAFEPALYEYMDEPPKARNEPILNKYMINQIVFDGIYAFFISIWFLKSHFIHNLYMLEYTDRYLYSAFFGLFIFLAIFNAFNARTNRINVFSNILRNKIFILIILFISIVQILLIYFGGELFRTTGLTFVEFEVMILIALSIIPFDMIRKLVLKLKRVNRTI